MRNFVPAIQNYQICIVRRTGRQIISQQDDQRKHIRHSQLKLSLQINQLIENREILDPMR